MLHDQEFLQHRRAFLGRTSSASASLALGALVASDGRRPRRSHGRGSRRARVHHQPTADAVICLFQHGGPSQMDLFDPKPELTKRRRPALSGGDLEVHFVKQKGNVLGSPFKFQPHGQCGMELCELLPHTAEIADDMTLDSLDDHRERSITNRRCG